MLPLFFASFVLFALASLGIGIGVLVRGKRLTGSCGGVGANGETLGDCLCARQKEEERRTALGDPSLIQLAELAGPSQLPRS